MTYGFELRRLNQSIIMDSTTYGGVFLEIINIPGGQTSSKSYPEVAGNFLYFLTLKSGRHTLSVDANTSGFGRINWTATSSITTSGDTIVAVFAKRVSVSASYGLMIYNDKDEVVATHAHMVPQFIGTVQPAAVATSASEMINGGFKYVHTVQTGAVANPGTLIFFLCAIPNGDGSNIWYSWTPWIYGSGGEVDVTVYAEIAGSYVVPTLHMYSINQAPVSTGLYGFEVYDAMGALTFTASEKNLAVANEFKMSFPDKDLTSTYTLTLPTKAGIFMPSYSSMDLVLNNRETEYAGVVKRSGNQLTFKHLKTVDNPAEPNAPGYSLTFGTKNDNHCMIVNLDEHGAGSTPGDPGTINTLPQILSQPMSVTKSTGETASFSVTASGSPTPTYTWYRNNVEVSTAGNSYSESVESGENGVEFKVEVKNSVGAVMSETAILSVNAHTAVAISQHPQSTSAQDGSGNITLSVAASGTAPITYQWYDAGTSGTNYTLISGATGTSHSVSAVSANNGKRFFCRAKNTSPGGTVYEADSNMATITITAADANAYIVSHPSSITRASGATATFSVTAGGTGPFSYQWYFGASLMTGKTSSSMSVTTSGSTTGQYRCRVIGATGVEVYSNYATLTLGVPPTVTSQPTGRVVTAGTSVTFTFGTSGATSWEWFRRTEGTGWLSYASGNNSISPSTSTEGTWEFYCEASNAYGSTLSNEVVLTVTAATPAPVISTQPQSATITLNASHSLYIVSSNTTRYQWYKNNVAFGADSNTCQVSSNATGTFNYKCRAYNGLSVYTESSTAVITVNEDTSVPQIITYPTGGQVAVNGSKTLSTTVKYADNVQWWRDDVHIGGTASGGATQFSSSKVVDTSVAGTYVYRMQATHINGNYVSHTVVVTVGTPQ